MSHNHSAITAPDGAIMWWDIRKLPETIGRVEFFNADGVCQNVISGTIKTRDLDRLIAKFRREHSGQGRLV